MKINYDPKANAVYIELAKGKYEASREISDSVVVDEDKNGKILGVEVLYCHILDILEEKVTQRL